jgi:hypothetical protein
MFSDDEQILQKWFSLYKDKKNPDVKTIILENNPQIESFFKIFSIFTPEPTASQARDLYEALMKEKD